ncbi:MAG: UvrD-helicase domain-containing protein, partial [Treponema sp.]|nr:UvrD-helicase domain-containing protein [Treponema sp.]
FNNRLISSAKDRYESPEAFAAGNTDEIDWKKARTAKIYAKYAQKLRAANALDFDDIIYHTVTLLQQEPEVLAYYQNKFRYVLVDEYQDTNHLQYLLTSLLAGGRKNLCVVGDDDQSIYRFRGANIENILSFEKQYRNARVIRLEQNYRSTQNILDAANAVIKNNLGRKGKTLWTDNGNGDVVTVKTTFNESDEANYVVGDIVMGVNRGRNFRDSAILYRMNAQSNALEYAMKRNGIPYKVVGGMKFFDRAEVKDMLAYLCVLNNPLDDLRLRRIINNPPRGIGATSLDKVDMKEYREEKATYTVSQIEVGNLKEILDRKKEFLSELEIERRSNKAIFASLLVTDITQLSSILLMSTDENFKPFVTFPSLETDIYFLKDVVSRKKQLIPLITEQVENFER